jgi:hypothetical protein
VQHNEADIDRLIANFAVFARAAGPGTGGLSQWRTCSNILMPASAIDV